MKPSLRSTAALIFLLAAAACGSAEGPSIASNTPINEAKDVPINTSIEVTFTEPMDPASLTPSSFVVTSDATGAVIPGTVIYADNKAVFWPAAHLEKNTSFTVRITTGAKTVAGVAIASERVWKFTTGATVESDKAVNLGAAGNFALLAKSGVSTVPTSVVTGNIGVSPAAASYITGFSLVADSTNTFSSSAQVTGKIYAADYASPSPSELTTSVSAMELAFVDAAGRPPAVTELGDGNIGGMTLAPGVYKWGTGVLIPTNVTLNGPANAVWIFQIAQDLTVSGATNVMLTGGARAKNIFWQVSGRVEIGTTAHFEGVILSQTAIAMRKGSSINGRLLAQTAIELDTTTVAQPEQ